MQPYDTISKRYIWSRIHSRISLYINTVTQLLLLLLLLIMLDEESCQVLYNILIVVEMICAGFPQASFRNIMDGIAMIVLEVPLVGLIGHVCDTPIKATTVVEWAGIVCPHYFV